MKEHPKPASGTARHFIESAWSALPGGSFIVLNGHMGAALWCAVTGNMSFDLDDLRTLADTTRLGRWIGADHERLYSAACTCQRGSTVRNPSFCQAYEKWQGREPFLWAEETKTATRLYVGAELTWEGHRVTVTSFSADGKYLTACTYKQQKRSHCGEVGSLEYTHGPRSGYRRLEAVATSDEGHLMVRYSPIVEGGDGSTTVDRRFKIELSALKAARKAYDNRRRAYERQIAGAENLEALEVIRTAAAAENPQAWRHFDIESLRETFGARKAAIIKAPIDAAAREANERCQEEQARRRAELDATHDADLARWMVGEPVRRYFNVVRLRVVGEWVETSTGQKATVRGVRAALAFVKKHRAGWQKNGTSFDLDQYPLEEITATGVQVGCTFVEWSEVDRIAKLLKK